MIDHHTAPVEDPAGRPAADRGQFLFWVLVGLAWAVFAPCVVLPVWREYQALQYAEQVERTSLTQARAALAHEKRRLSALENDPATIRRVARRELHYRDPHEVTIPVDVPLDPSVETKAAALTRVEPPASVAWIVRRFPKTDYDRLFCDPPTRTLLMCLAGGLLLSAFVIFSPRRPARRANRE